MALEDRFLKKNIPGKYSWWEQDSDAERDDGSDSDDNERLAYSHAPLGTSRPSNKSGVKGRLSEYRQVKRSKARQQLVERLEQQEIIDRITQGATLSSGELPMSAAAVEERRRANTTETNCSDSSLQESDSDDGDFMDRYRQKRLMQLKSEYELPVFGSVEEVGPSQYADAIDETDPRVFLVVHLYEPFVPACSALNNHLELLARDMDYARFLRLRASAASKTLDPICLPSIVVYKGGELLHNLTPVTQHLPQHFNSNDVQSLLESCKVLKNPRSTQRINPYSVPKTRQVISRPVRDSEDDELDEFCRDFDKSLTR